ncbi:DNA ligase D [Hyalangium rubrum]|uniref:DNA ligase (ATP) n=1 Tax=Hyalangium rubrum TaxID=3103134 RepID=A0ABU5H0W5_9BACT|nr:DNA ligase D [Hyalangium sp. s54d21]MDY7227090.1 DNA ligase D [Hyalangium sp. s54d21]
MKTRHSLRAYRAKRDFQKTSEPSPDVPLERHGSEPMFVVHKHDATRMHYDLRLEIDGALASWAIPKGPSYDPSTKRLAVQTEDHPLSYAEFEGRIPDDEYGGGDSLLWDRGTFETVPPGKGHEQREKGHLTVELHGEKLKGRWHLIRTKMHGKQNQWLCFKALDGTEDPNYDVTVERPESVKSGRKETRGPVRKSALVALRHPGAKELIERVWPPMLAKLSVPDEARDDTHVYEVKYDGFRAVAAISGGQLALWSRNGNDLSERFPSIAEALRGMRVPEAVLDGEIVAVDSKGRSRFQLLQNQSGGELRFVAFDLLWLDGEDLRSRSLEARRELLESVLSGAKSPVQLSERLELPLTRALSEAQKRGWEGLIAKRRGSTYVGSRSSSWLKLKVIAGQEFVISGYLPIKNEQAGKEIGALLVAVNGRNGYVDVGKVGTGFTTKVRRELRAMLDKERTAKPIVADAKYRSEAVWVKPKYVAQIHFTEWTEEGRLRHPVFQGLRTDKKPQEVVRERPSTTARGKAKEESTAMVPKRTRKTARTATPAAKPRKRAAAKRSASRETGARRVPSATAARTAKLPAGELLTKSTGQARLTSGERVLYPKDGYTKADVFAYYGEVAPLLVPVLADRPISVQQWPAGIQAPGFFKHDLTGKPDWLPTLRVKHVDRTIDHVNVKTPDALLWLANQSALTIHMWASRAPKLEQAQWVLFDLDPGKGSWEDLIKVATVLHKRLDQLGLESIPKTSGKRGIHVFIPLGPGHTHEDAVRFSSELANQVAAELRDIATTERAINKRQGRLYIDAGQNGRGKTVVAPYSLRAVDGANFSAPLKWSEVTKRLDPSRFNLKTLRKRLDAVGDLFAPVLKGKQKLP